MEERKALTSYESAGQTGGIFNLEFNTEGSVTAFVSLIHIRTGMHEICSFLVLIKLEVREEGGLLQPIAWLFVIIG